MGSPMVAGQEPVKLSSSQKKETVDTIAEHHIGFGHEFHESLAKMEPTSMHIDPIEELRHRRWARENYVPADARDDSWHAIILEEMLQRDTELRELERNRGPKYAVAESLSQRAPMHAPLTSTEA